MNVGAAHTFAMNKSEIQGGRTYCNRGKGRTRKPLGVCGWLLLRPGPERCCLKKGVAGSPQTRPLEGRKKTPQLVSGAKLHYHPQWVKRFSEIIFDTSAQTASFVAGIPERESLEENISGAAGSPVSPDVESTTCPHSHNQPLLHTTCKRRCMLTVLMPHWTKVVVSRWSSSWCVGG